MGFHLDFLMLRVMLLLHKKQLVGIRIVSQEFLLVDLEEPNLSYP